MRPEAVQALRCPVPSCGHRQWERALQLLTLTLLEPAPPTFRRPDPADSHVLDEGVHPAGRPRDAALLLWDPDRRLALPGL